MSLLSLKVMLVTAVATCSCLRVNSLFKSEFCESLQVYRHITIRNLCRHAEGLLFLLLFVCVVCVSYFVCLLILLA